jgi:hypothetical protein
MNMRERILVVLMALAVLVGGYSMFFGAKGGPGKTTPSVATPANLEGVIEGIRSTVRGVELSEVDKYRLASAQAEWRIDPFHVRSTALATEADGKLGEIRFDYTGYVRFGSKNVAVINGREYEQGEALESHGYVLRTILPDRIVIVRDQGSGKPGTITVPLQEELTFQELR